MVDVSALCLDILPFTDLEPGSSTSVGHHTLVTILESHTTLATMSVNDFNYLYFSHVHVFSVRYSFTILSYLIGIFIFAAIVGEYRNIINWLSF